MQKNVPGICLRLAALRLTHFGARGKTRFAAELGIGPSSYHRYEIDRTPPAELLARAAERTNTSLHWLLTGEGEMSPGSASAASKPAGGNASIFITRIEALLARTPELERSLTGFLDLLENVSDTFPNVAADDHASARLESLLPVVGGTAAGPARFWEEAGGQHGGPEADSRLEELLSANSDRAVREAEFVATSPALGADGPVALVQWSRPDELGFVEFVACPTVKSKFPQAVCWRIDGDSMSPRYRDGDLVITSADRPAIDGHPCIARQTDQIGVNCKIYKDDGDHILLIPVNEAYSPERLPRSQLQWAHRVLYSVRLSGNR